MINHITIHMDWYNQLENITKVPETVDEAVNRLVTLLDDEHKLAISTMQESDLIDLHFSLGIAIRNAFELHDQDSELLKSLGPFVHPDDVSMMIIGQLWHSLQDKGK